ncbi:hypothetical protein [Helicobacter sp. 23-1046]
MIVKNYAKIVCLFFTLSIANADNFITLGGASVFPSRELPSNYDTDIIDFVEARGFLLAKKDADIGMFDESYALYITSKKLTKFIDGDISQGKEKIRIMRTKNGLLNTRSSGFYYYTKMASNNHAFFAPRAHALYQVKPYIFLISDYIPSMEKSACLLVRSNAFVKETFGIKIDINLEQNYADSKNASFWLECESTQGL